jgi:pimeloyl-ACP methyl ester carboxylesterase
VDEVISHGDPDAPAAVIAHGSGSTADFVVRAFGESIAGAGYRLVTWDRRVAPRDGAAEFRALADRESAVLVGGVSIGALFAVRYAIATAATRPLDGLLVALPCWLGDPGAVAALSAAAADRISTQGLAASLGEIGRAAVGWVADEISRAWPAYGEKGIETELRDTAATAGPTSQELAGCELATGLVALTGDPFHPAETAAQWAAALPQAHVEMLGLDAPAGGIDVIGAAAMRALHTANLSGSR